MSALALWLAILGYAVMWRGVQGLSTPEWRDTGGVKVGLIASLTPPGLGRPNVIDARDAALNAGKAVGAAENKPKPRNPAKPGNAWTGAAA